MAGDPVQDIVAGLTPYIGEHMARSAALAHCQKASYGVIAGGIRRHQRLLVA